MRSRCEFQSILTCSSWSSPAPVHSHVPSPTCCTADSSLQLHVHRWETHVGIISSHLRCKQISKKFLYITLSDSVSSAELGLSHPDSTFSFTILFSTEESNRPLHLLSMSHIFPLHFPFLPLSLSIVPCLVIQSPS